MELRYIGIPSVVGRNTPRPTIPNVVSTKPDQATVPQISATKCAAKPYCVGPMCAGAGELPTLTKYSRTWDGSLGFGKNSPQTA